MLDFLNIKGTILDKCQLQNYFEKMASDNVLKSKTDRKTYPIPRLNANFEFITEVYNLLNEHLKIGINVHPAGEWLLDNYYIIEETIKSIKKDLTVSRYTNFIGIGNGIYKGYARIYVLAAEMVAYTENRIDNESLVFMLNAYQNKKSLTMEEIWNIGLFVQIAIIENISDICEKIYSSQLQKYQVENIIERLLDYRPKEEQKYKINKGYKAYKLGYGEMKYPFIEYMSYRLKKYGRKAHNHLDILEDQVNKMGTNISEVIKKEHYDMAIKKVLIGNGIKTIKNIQRINFAEIFEQINEVEEMLKKDPCNIYEKMDYKTKELYRNKIKEISKSSKISEIYISEKILELSEKYFEKTKEYNNYDEVLKVKHKKKSHIGYFLISDGITELYNELGIKSKISNINKKNKSKIYMYSIVIISVLLSLLVMRYTHNRIGKLMEIIIVGLSFIPITEILIKLTQYILGKIVKPKLIPKIDLYKGIPKDNATVVVIPTIIDSKKKIKEIVSKLETYYWANKSENIYFALLGDCKSGSKEKEKIDEEIVEEGRKLINDINNKYSNNGFPIFHFLYRKRKWNKKEKTYLGWERKRGLLNQFNKYLLKNEKSDFIANTFEEYILDNYDIELPKIKYVITLDSDTELSLNSAFELVGAMTHILNKPIVNNGIVTEGHALIQPKVGIDLKASNKSIFTKIFAGAGGTDSYTNAISDIYQDNFGEGIFTGKGIYDLEVFEKVLKDEIPENKVLSHDLLEGCYLRCGLASDVLVMDGYPYKYNSFMERYHRWIRGDWQIISWTRKKIKDEKGSKKNNPLSGLSKFKILDNLRRSLLEISSLLLITISIIIKIRNDINVNVILFVGVLSVLLPAIIEIINKIIDKKDGQEMQKTFTPIVDGVKGIVLRGFFAIAFLPHKAYISLSAIIKTVYRLLISKEKLLEWVTAEESEKNAITSYKKYYINMFSNIIFTIIFMYFYINTNTNSYYIKVLSLLLSLIWIIGPVIACYISKKEKEELEIEKLDKKDNEYVLEIARKTWNYFKDTIIEKNNYLPPDNYQESRAQKFVTRTSSTNIGLGILSIISSYDLGFESLKDSLELLDKMIKTIVNLEKWNGHLYNWYNIETTEPLTTRYVSTVDSGNFVGYLYVLKQFYYNLLEENEKKYIKESISKEKILEKVKQIDEIITNTDFTILYNEKVKLFSIGYNVDENRLDDSYYDLLASEARQASLIAIAKKDVPAKHWNSLSRTLTTLNKYKGLISWSGTAFEYLMPNINIKKYKGSLLDESCKFMIMSQKEYSKKIGIPWGMSESAYNLKDLNANYQYKAFGIPWLGLKRGLADEIVVSSYGSVIAINEEANNVVNNIKKLEKEGVFGKYGLYEAIDYTISRLKYGEKSAVVKTFMAHHQALILLSINNLFNKNILEKRFSLNPEIKAVDILLQERMPANVIVTKEEKEKVEKLKYIDYDNHSERRYNKIDENLVKWNVISNENYTIAMNQKGEGYSKYKDIYINRYKETSDYNQGIHFFIKNIKSKRIWSNSFLNYLSKPDKYDICFTPSEMKIKRIDGNIETVTKTTISANEAVEIRRIELKNNGTEEEIFEVTGFFEPIISNKLQDISHMAFNNLFLRYKYLEETNSILIERRSREENVDNIYLGVSFYTEDESVGDIEYEIDREKFYGRGNLNIPEMVENSKPFSKSLGLVTDPAIALKRIIKIKPNKKISLNLIITVSNNNEEVIENLNKFNNDENIKRTFGLSKVRNSEEARYLGLKGKDIEIYQNMLSLVFFTNKTKKIYIDKYANRTYSQSELWKFGISGDSPIILVKIKDVNDIHVVENLIKAYEYFRTKNINTELVILNEEKYSYEEYVKDAIENAILNRHISYMKNIKDGIFVISSNEISEEDRDLLNFKANIIIDSSLGEIETQLEALEEDYLLSIKNITENELKQMIIQEEKIRGNALDKKDTIDNLKYYNEYGAFSSDGKEYIIKVNKDQNLPTVWGHILANENFGTFITEGMGGYTWNKNSRLNRISAWNNNTTTDIPSEIIYLVDSDASKAWSIGSRPMQDDNDYYITYGFGYAKYEHTSLGVLQEVEVFVPIQESIKVNLLKLKNTTPDKKKFKLLYYIKPVLGEDETKSNGYIYVSKSSNIVYAKNLYSEEFKDQISYISSSENIKSYTGNKNSFIGSKGIQDPIALKSVKLDDESGLGSDSCIAIELEIDLEPYEKKEFSLLLGQEDNVINAKDTVYKYTNLSNCKQELAKVKKYWYDLSENIQVKTPVESTNILLNGWLIYQTITSRLWGRTGYYQSGGAYGFRDQLQDTLGLKFVNPDFMKNQIIKHSKRQFIEGDVQHWWHEETKRGIRTRFSDDLLWLVYVVCEYIKFTDDMTILDIKTPYLEGEELEEGIIEKYDLYNQSDLEEDIYSHCIKAIERSLDFGENGLPKIGSGDWNDGLSEVGIKGNGESIWLGFFIYDILTKFIPYINKREDFEKSSKYEQIKDKLKRALNTNGWDGRWYKRAVMDNGDILGSIENDECKIDNIAQSWSIISNAGDNDKKYICMESLENHLIDRENGIIKLLDPPFDKGKLEPGYIKSYLPGVRENGGQYTHGAIWTIISQTMLGFGDKAVEFFRMINPIEHSKTREAAIKYKVEPYVISADIYGSDNLIGRGGWSWYTGSSGWMYKAGIENILGLKIEEGILKMEPCISKDWKEYSIRYRYKTSIYNIKVKNPNMGNIGIKRFVVDGKDIEKKQLKLIDDGAIHDVYILM